jgi:hypothetical protein
VEAVRKKSMKAVPLSDTEELYDIDPGTLPEEYKYLAERARLKARRVDLPADEVTDDASWSWGRFRVEVHLSSAVGVESRADRLYQAEKVIVRNLPNFCDFLRTVKWCWEQKREIEAYGLERDDAATEQMRRDALEECHQHSVRSSNCQSVLDTMCAVMKTRPMEVDFTFAKANCNKVGEIVFEFFHGILMMKSYDYMKRPPPMHLVIDASEFFETNDFE